MESTSAVTWKRGLFRVWLVFSALWIGGSLIMGLTDSGIPSVTTNCSERLFRDQESGEVLGGAARDAKVAECQRARRKKLTELLVWALSPPLTLLLIGAGVPWLVRGFRRGET
jgi:hypothetical protein